MAPCVGRPKGFIPTGVFGNHRATGQKPYQGPGHKGSIFPLTEGFQAGSFDAVPALPVFRWWKKTYRLVTVEKEIGHGDPSEVVKSSLPELP